MKGQHSSSREISVCFLSCRYHWTHLKQLYVACSVNDLRNICLLWLDVIILFFHIGGIIGGSSKFISMNTFAFPQKAPCFWAYSLNRIKNGRRNEEAAEEAAPWGDSANFPLNFLWLKNGLGLGDVNAQNHGCFKDYTYRRCENCRKGARDFRSETSPPRVSIRHILVDVKEYVFNPFLQKDVSFSISNFDGNSWRNTRFHDQCLDVPRS